MWMRAPKGRLGTALIGNEGALVDDPTLSRGSGSRWGWGIAAGVGVAVAAAAIVGAIEVASGYLLGWWLTLGVGWVIGVALGKVGRVSGPAAGGVGALLGLFSWALTAVFFQVGLTAKQIGTPFFDVLERYTGVLDEVIKGHLEMNPTEYVSIAATALGAFIGASKGIQKRKKA